MQNQKEDRRIRITKRAIRESLVELMQTVPIAKISVKMICETADINRSTFYAHYTDSYDLLRKLQRDIIADIKEHLFSVQFKGHVAKTVPVIVQVLEYAKENATLVKVLLSGNGDASFQNELMYLMQEKVIDEIREDQRLDDHTTKYVELFAISGVESIVYQWLVNGCADDSGKLAELITALLTSGVYGLYR